MRNNEIPDLHKEKWLPILEPIFQETDGFTPEEWEAWTKNEENKDKVAEILMAFFELDIVAYRFPSSEVNST